MKQLSKANWIRLACFSAGGTILFYLVPLILMQLPDPAKGNAMVILVMFVNQVFMGAVGWHSNYFGKWGIYIPMVLIVLYGISEVLFFGGNRLEYGDQLPSDRLYHLFLKTDYEQETADAGTKESGKLPEGNGEKVIQWTADYKNPPSIVIICPVK